MLSWWRRKKSKSECPFCYPITKLEASSRGTFSCPSCSTRFEQHNGELESVLPPMSNEATPSRRTCIPLEQGRLAHDDSLLCRTCLNHQNVLLQLLGAYDPTDDNESHYHKYREDLERRYPLCVTCRARVQERLRVVEYKVRCRRLARNRTTQVASIRKDRTIILRMRSIGLLDIFLIQSVLFTGLFLAEWKKVDLTLIPLSKLVEEYFVWYAVVIPPAMMVVMENYRNLLKCGWALFLLLLRMAMINLIANGAILIPDLSPPPYLLLNVACYGLLYLLYSSDRKGKDLVKNPTNPFPVPSMDVPMRRVATTGEEELTSKLASSWDTGLVEKLDPKTPLSTRFTDLDVSRSSRSSNSSPFSIPKFPLASSTPQSQQKTPSFSMRPSVMDANRNSGLESVLEGFTLNEGKKSHRNPTDVTSMDHIVLTVSLMLARIAIDRQVSLIAMLLVVSIGLRGPTWRNLQSSIRLTVNVAVLLRLCWLIAMFHVEMFPDWKALHERAMNVEYVVDMLIIFSR